MSPNATEEDRRSAAVALAGLIAEAAGGRDVDEMVPTARFAGWISELMDRYDCRGVPSVDEPLQEIDGQKFWLRLLLIMVEISYRRLIAPHPPLPEALVASFERLLEDRPRFEPKLLQEPATLRSSLRRAMEIRRVLGPGLHSVLFVGDDDLSSLALALLDRSPRIFVVDLDLDLLEFLASKASLLQADLTTEVVDLRTDFVPFHLSGRFSGVVADPPRDDDVCLKFLHFGARCLSTLGTSYLFWADHPDWNLWYWKLVHEELPKIGLRLRETIEELHEYPVKNEYYREPAERISSAFDLPMEWLESLTPWVQSWSHLHVLVRDQELNRANR